MDIAGRIFNIGSYENGTGSNRRRLSLKNVLRLRVVTVVTILMVITVVTFKQYTNIATRVIYRSQLSSEDLFEPDVFEDIATVEDGKTIIPHIIHQTYKDEFIPKVFSGYVKSFITHNPSWKYYFWTDETSKRFIADHYPIFLPVWNSYNMDINRADALRYFVLYEIGGVYADLDVECFRSLDRVTKKYSAIFPPEPPEHCLKNRCPFLISNAIMMTRPKHPFLKYIIDTIANFQSMAEKIDVAGPSFVTTQFMMYNKFKPGDAFKKRIENNTNSPYFYKGPLKEDDTNAVYVPNTRYFMRKLGYTGRGPGYFAQLCNERYDSGNVIIRKGCHEHWLRGTEEDRKQFRFTDHQWYNTYYNPIKTFQHIKGIVPNYTIYIGNV